MPLQKIRSPEFHGAGRVMARLGPQWALALLQPYPARQIIMYSVSKCVGNLKCDDPELIEPAA